MRLNEYKLAIPPVALDDWQKAIESASGLLRDILTAQAHGARLLQSINETTATTERIGWLNIWAKTFAALEAVAAAVTHNSSLVLLLSRRNTFEVMLQMHTILDPLLNLAKTQSRNRHDNEYALRSCIDRLRAYTAWCLWHDKAYYQEVLNPKSMRDIWNFDSSREKQHAAPQGPVCDEFSTNVNIPRDEASMQRGSRFMRKWYSDKIRQIDEWMVDPQLKKWEAVIDRASKNNIVGVPFFILFDRSDASIPKRLLKEGMRFSYSAYIMSSMASHGSSMQEFIHMQEDTIKPALTGDKDQINNLAPEIIFRCRHLFTLLEMINLEMLKNPHLRS